MFVFWWPMLSLCGILYDTANAQATFLLSCKCIWLLRLQTYKHGLTRIFVSKSMQLYNNVTILKSIIPQSSKEWLCCSFFSNFNDQNVMLSYWRLDPHSAFNTTDYSDCTKLSTHDGERAGCLPIPWPSVNTSEDLYVLTPYLHYILKILQSAGLCSLTN